MRGFYPGSFDPPTLGHEDLIRRALCLVDSLVIGVGYNPVKPVAGSLLEVEARQSLLKAICQAYEPVEVCLYQGATVDAVRQHAADVLIRGLRSSQDLEDEMALAEMNRRQGVETLFLCADCGHRWVSASMVRQALAAGLSLTGLVSPLVAQALGRT